MGVSVALKVSQNLDLIGYDAAAGRPAPSGAHWELR
jgi:hypothetical protein